MPQSACKQGAPNQTPPELVRQLAGKCSASEQGVALGFEACGVRRVARIRKRVDHSAFPLGLLSSSPLIH